MTPTTTNIRSNKFAGDCTLCNQRVPAGEGKLLGSAGNWHVEHNVCPAPVAAPAPAPASVPVAKPVNVDEDIDRLRKVLDFIKDRDLSFAQDLVVKFDRYGRISDGQRKYVRKFAAAGEKAQEIVQISEVLAPVTRQILARVDGRASVRVAIPSGGKNDLDFLAVFANRIERHMGAPGSIRKQPLAVAASVTLATRILELTDAEFVKAQHVYGEAMGECGKCGSSLSDLTSRARGFGPDCWEHVDGEYTVGNTDELVVAYKLAHPDFEEVQPPQRSWPTGLFADPCKSECD
jgi:hypothetical protein